MNSFVLMPSTIYPSLDSEGERRKDTKSGSADSEPKKANTLDSVCGVGCYEVLNRCHPMVTQYDKKKLEKKDKGCFPCCRRSNPPKAQFCSAFLSIGVTLQHHDTKIGRVTTRWGSTLSGEIRENISIGKVEEIIASLSDVKTGPALIDNCACRDAICSRFVGESVGMRRSLYIKAPGDDGYSKTTPHKFHLSQDGNTLVLVSEVQLLNHKEAQVTILGRNNASILDTTFQTLCYCGKMMTKLEKEKVISEFHNIASGVKLYGGARVRKAIAKAVKGTNVVLIHGNNDDPKSFELRVKYKAQDLSASCIKKFLLDNASNLHQVYNRFC